MQERNDSGCAHHLRHVYIPMTQTHRSQKYLHQNGIAILHYCYTHNFEVDGTNGTKLGVTKMEELTSTDWLRMFPFHAPEKSQAIWNTYLKSWLPRTQQKLIALHSVPPVIF